VRVVAWLVAVGIGFVSGATWVAGNEPAMLVSADGVSVASARDGNHDPASPVSSPPPGAPRLSADPTTFPAEDGPSGETSAETLDPALRPPPAAIFETLPTSLDRFESARAHLDREPSSETGAPWNPARLVEWVQPPRHRSDLAGPLRVEYSMDVELTRRVFEVLRRARMANGHVIVIEPESGRVLAYVSSDPVGFPATAAYPAASLVKVVTAAAALDVAPEEARQVCRYNGSPYRLTPARLRPPRSGNEMDLERSLATSNNQCFAQLAVNAIGGAAMLSAIERFGWTTAPAPGHVAGTAEVGDDDYQLGKLGCGLAGCKITPLHAAQLAASLAHGELVEPWWIERVVDVHGRALPLPTRQPARRIMRPELAEELREMLVRTTTRGTARSAFRDRRGRQLLGSVRVAGKTGNLNGDEPPGRYEWFVAVAPAESPTIAVAVLQLHGDRWWMRSSQIGAEILSGIFCEKSQCKRELAFRYANGSPQTAARRRSSDLGS
jgi:hypothetical protein